MLISDLNYLEVVSEETAIEGGSAAYADAWADARAKGRQQTYTDANVYTDVYVDVGYFTSDSSAYASSSAI